MKEKRSDDYYVDIPEGLSKREMGEIVERATAKAGLYISHIGGYSRTKYPNSVHWHFKRDPNEAGLLDATSWDVKSLGLRLQYAVPSTLFRSWMMKSTPQNQQLISSPRLGQKRKSWIRREGSIVKSLWITSEVHVLFWSSVVSSITPDQGRASCHFNQGTRL